MSTNYYIKIYYSKTINADPEIRRFSIDVSPDRNSYRELKEKLASLYPDHDMTGVSLQYIDDENERVTFSTDEELRSAIELNKGSNNLKIFAIGPVTSTTSTTKHHQEDSMMSDESPDEIPEEIHLDCLSNGHSHNRKTKARSSTSTFHSNGSFHPGVSHQHLHHHARAHKLHHRRHGPSTFTPPSHFLQHVQAQIPQWLPNRENTAHITEHIKDHLASIKNNTQTYMQNSKEYLENVGQYLQQALSPLGIDCDYHVGENSNATRTETTTRTETSTHTNESNKMETNSETANHSTERETNQASSSSETEVLDKNIEFCLAKLKSMGFNDNDALTNLVRSKNGDINAVLDAINPRRTE